MKRSRRIKLVLLTGLSAGAVTGCDPPTGSAGAISADGVYTNDHYVPGVGYYHAPFRDWYLFPYNYFDQNKQQYYFGGQWATAPHESITNISSPTAAVVQSINARRTDIQRGGFGSSSQGRHIWS